MDESIEPVRIDRWLWAARMFHSRSLATEACDGGKVSVNGQNAKPSKLVRPGDLIEVTQERVRRKLKLVATGVRRGPAAAARELYEDLTPPPPPREGRVDWGPQFEPGSGRPTKRDRRRMDRLRSW